MAKSRKIYYTMGQVCEMFDLPASTVRYWEQKFKILAPRKNAKGNRLFTPTDVENLKLIYHLTKEKKMTLSGAEEYITRRKTAARSELTVVEVLQRIKATLVEIRQEIESTEVEQKSLKSTITDKNKTTEVIIFSEQITEEDLFSHNDEKCEECHDEKDSPFTQLSLF